MFRIKLVKWLVKNLDRTTKKTLLCELITRQIVEEPKEETKTFLKSCDRILDIIKEI